MVELTPTQRLEALLQKQHLGEAHAALSRILEQYEKFLESTNADEKELVDRFLKKQSSKTYMTDAYEFGDLVFDAMTSIGKAGRFHRLLVVLGWFRIRLNSCQPTKFLLPGKVSASNLLVTWRTSRCGGFLRPTIRA